jgi:acyl-coenzyme A thioesterase PaaI-like protein
VDATSLAANMLESVPANATLRLRVTRAVDGVGEVELDGRPDLGNVIGALHSSGLVGLVDATCLAAVISGAQHPAQLDGVLPLGATAHLEFRAPARGRLLGRCELGSDDLETLRAVYTDRTSRGRLTTTTDVLDTSGVAVCRGTFTWSIKRRP